MALSGSIDLTITAGSLISRALGKIGVRGQGFTISSDEMAEGLDTFNELMQTWSTDGPNLWTPDTQNIPLVTGTQTYTLTTRPRLVQSVNLRDDTAALEMLPLQPWNQQDWDRFIYKTSTGLPLRYLVQKLRTSTTLTLWPLPTFTSGTYSINVGYERVWQIITDASQSVDIPQDGVEAVVLCLAARFIEDYQLPEDANTQRIRQRAETLYNQFMSFDRTGEVRLVRQ